MLNVWIRNLERLDWPVFTLELRRARRSEKSFFYSLVVAFVMGVLGVVFMINSPENASDYWFGAPLILGVGQGFLIWVFTVIIVTGYSSRVIASDLESRRFDYLAMTAMSSREIILQKAAQPIVYALAIAVVLLPLDLLMSVRQGVLDWGGLNTLTWLLGATIVNTAIGILSSCLFAKARTATLVSYLVILIGPMFLAPLLAVLSLLMGINGFWMQGTGHWVLERLPYPLVWSVLIAAVLLHVATWRVERLRRLQ